MDPDGPSFQLSRFDLAREDVCSASEHVVVCLPFVVAGCVYVNVRLRMMWVGCEPAFCTAGSAIPPFVLQLQRALIQSSGLLNSRQLI